MPTSKTGRNGSRVTQRLNKKARGGQVTKRALTIDDFDLNKHANGGKVDPVEGREARLPYVIRGMRENKSIREIAFECNSTPATISYDKKWVLEEAWELRHDMMGLWLEEQFQGYERLLSVLDKELMVEVMVPEGEGKNIKWVPKKDAKGNPVLVSSETVMSRMLKIMDKVDELKGLKQANVIIPIMPGADATINFNQDAAAAHELLDVLKPGKVGSGKTALIS